MAVERSGGWNSASRSQVGEAGEQASSRSSPRRKVATRNGHLPNVAREGGDERGVHGGGPGACVARQSPATRRYPLGEMPCRWGPPHGIA